LIIAAVAIQSGSQQVFFNVKEQILKKHYIAVSVALMLSGVLAACDNNKPTIAGTSESTSTPQKMENAADKTGQALDDSAITAKAKLALAGESDLKSMSISVGTVQGRVTLSGNVPSEAESQRAATVVSALEGVKGVDNRLVVKTPG
jgi:hypothetical protein